MMRKSGIARVGLAVFVLGWILASGNIARAVVVSTTTGNTTVPADDPGWNNVGVRGVYLGDRWVLTAFHVGVGNISFGSQEYVPESNSAVRLKNSNGSDADLILYRLQSAPALPSLAISASAPQFGQSVVMIGSGINRQPTPTVWSVVENSNGSLTWTTPPQSGATAIYEGFLPDSGSTMRWGTNQISALSSVVSLSPYGEVTGFKTTFDNNGSSTPFEAQAVQGDSGGGVFYKRDGQWELMGIINAVSLYPDQPSGSQSAVYGDTTLISDLSVYRSQIMSVVPEPGTLSMLVGLTLAGFVAWAWRRKR